VSASLPTLQYADVPARWGVSVERTPSAFRLAVEPSGWRAITPGYIVAIGVLLFLSIGPIVGGRQAGRIEWPAVIINAIVYLVPALGIALFLWKRLRQRVLFIVTVETFTGATLDASGRGRVLSLPKAEVGYVKRNPYNGHLSVQHVGKDLFDFYVSPSREVVEYVAAQIAEALTDPPTEPAGNALSLPPRPRSRLARPAAITASLIMALMGIILLFFVDHVIAKPVGFYILLFSAIPVGIAFGTQPKKFWV
jgi:hypothetical protein